MIGLVARILAVSVEDLTVVVLAHELAHAYTHLGKDIDGHRWGWNEFAHSERALKEGLAQYYTHRVCVRLDSLTSGDKAAFDKLLEKQPPEYRVHRKWVENSTPEEVRLAMIESRRTGAVKLHRFEESLRIAQSQLRAEPRR